eukprot:TRINITY_DN66296_c0_g1_i1.p1 TRINITY_DN66296_c0_g1~~TRINITY_DN66296_c0_g1_i1.p1  ORF type:complete len:223 (+),score=21.83 TRINITY_DN66296_c0_g1_i1:642-1310(+)
MMYLHVERPNNTFFKDNEIIIFYQICRTIGQLWLMQMVEGFPKHALYPHIDALNATFQACSQQLGKRRTNTKECTDRQNIGEAMVLDNEKIIDFQEFAVKFHSDKEFVDITNPLVRALQSVQDHRSVSSVIQLHRCMIHVLNKVDPFGHCCPVHKRRSLNVDPLRRGKIQKYLQAIKVGVTASVTFVISAVGLHFALVELGWGTYLKAVRQYYLGLLSGVVP